MNIINTRADLDALAGTPAYLDALRALAGSMITTQDVAVCPDGYGAPDYAGPPVAPDWREIETLGTIERLGFSRASFEAEYAAVTADAGA